MNAFLQTGNVLAQLVERSAADPWAQTLFGLDAEKRFVLLVVAIGCSVGVILGTLGILSSTINVVHRRRMEADMKRDMIERGMSADEIAKIIEAAPPLEDGTARCIASWGGRKKV